MEDVLTKFFPTCLARLTRSLLYKNALLFEQFFYLIRKFSKIEERAFKQEKVLKNNSFFFYIIEIAPQKNSQTIRKKQTICDFTMLPVFCFNCSEQLTTSNIKKYIDN